MLVVRGINVFPGQIEDVLLKIREIGDYFQVTVDREKHKLDEIAIKVEVTDEAFTGELEDLARIQKKALSRNLAKSEILRSAYRQLYFIL